MIQSKHRGEYANQFGEGELRAKILTEEQCVKEVFGGRKDHHLVSCGSSVLRKLDVAMGNQALVFGSLPICKDAFGWYYSVEVKATRYQRGEFDDLCGSHGSCDCLEGRDIFFSWQRGKRNRHIIPLCCHQRDAQAQALPCHGHLQDMHLFENYFSGRFN